jgi:hypothetical protein
LQVAVVPGMAVVQLTEMKQVALAVADVHVDSKGQTMFSLVFPVMEPAALDLVAEPVDVVVLDLLQFNTQHHLLQQVQRHLLFKLFPKVQQDN